MATAAAQDAWRRKVRVLRRQLNVMLRRRVHDDLEEIADSYGLRGKGEAIAFATYVVRGLEQYREHDASAGHLLDVFERAYARDREMYR